MVFRQQQQQPPVRQWVRGQHGTQQQVQAWLATWQADLQARGLWVETSVHQQDGVFFGAVHYASPVPL